MPITSKQIEHYLEKGLELKYQTNENESSKQYIVQYGLDDDEVGDYNLAIVISLLDKAANGYEFIEFRAIGFDDGDKEKVKNSEYTQQLQEYMLASNHQYKIGTWSYDPIDGDSYLSCIHLIEDNEQVTGRQFVRLFETMLKLAAQSYIEFQRILLHGDATVQLSCKQKNHDVNRQQIEQLLRQLQPYAEGVAAEQDIELEHLALGTYQAVKEGILNDIPMLHYHLSKHQPQLERFAQMKSINLATVNSVYLERQHSPNLLSKIDEAIKTDDPVMYLINAALTDVVRYVQREHTAYHEAGHAVISLVLRPEWRLKEVSILEDKGSSGRVGMDVTNPIVHTPTTLEYVMEDICVRLAGQICQVKKFGSGSADTGAVSDFQSATKMAYTAVSIVGLDEAFGPVSLPQIAEMNGGISVKASGYLFDQAQIRTQEILKGAKKLTEKLVGESWSIIEAVAELLIERDSISESDVHDIFQTRTEA